MVAPDVQLQKQIMKALEEQQPPLREGDTWYLIDVGWYRRWKQFVQYDYASNTEVCRPEAIDNSGIIDTATGRVPNHLIEHSHFAILSKDEWDTLHSWFVRLTGREALPY